MGSARKTGGGPLPLEVSQAPAVRRTVFPPPWTPTDPTGRAISSESGYKDALQELGWHVLYAEVTQSLDSARRAFDPADRTAMRFTTCADRPGRRRTASGMPVTGRVRRRACR